ncbi:unnamed protein product [Moneuplotes crassus]|uniref:Uncharacterized protein n=1 Tax=Euplotes crassus TaxID=5936 RepID=A0AAD1XKG3_EUPCR|nr:unnamed protein product [Moneuplotes crassus]
MPEALISSLQVCLCYCFLTAGCLRFKVIVEIYFILRVSICRHRICILAIIVLYSFLLLFISNIPKRVSSRTGDIHKAHRSGFYDMNADMPKITNYLHIFLSEFLKVLHNKFCPLTLNVCRLSRISGSLLVDFLSS